jgi:Uma2 family endonuclease
MTAAGQGLSIFEYLADERRSATKSEYFAGKVVAMAGASFFHNKIALNIGSELRSALKDRSCDVATSDLRVQTPTEMVAYPDVVVVCGKPEFHDSERDTLLNPIAIVEVLSRSTEGFDRGGKFHNYSTIPSLREYLLVSQRQMRVDHFFRQPSGQWILTSYSKPEEPVQFPSLEVSIPLADIYLKVELPRAPSLHDDGSGETFAPPSPS